MGKQFSIFLLIPILLSGCLDAARTYVPYTPPPPPQPIKRTIEVVSEPPGAHIEVNENYVGDAPCTIEVQAKEDGTFFEKTLIRALPAQDGYTQTKFFYSYVTPLGPNKVPDKLFFQMNLGPVGNDYNININQ
jgi:PEGA domain